MRRVGVIAFAAAVLAAPVAAAQIQAGVPSAGSARDGFPLLIGNAANGFLIVAVAVEDVSVKVTGVTFGGRPLARIGALSGGAKCYLSLWRLAAPDTGTHALAAQLSPASAIGLMAATAYEGVDPVSASAPPALSSGVTSNALITATSTAGDLVVGAVCARANTSTVDFDTTAGQTLRTSARIDALALGLSDKAGAPSVTLSWPISSTAPAVSWTAATTSLRPAGSLAVVDAGGVDTGAPDLAAPDLAMTGGAPDLATERPSEPVPSEPLDAGTGPDGRAAEQPVLDGDARRMVDLHVVSACAFAAGPHSRLPLSVVVVLAALARRWRRRLLSGRRARS